MDTWLGTAIPVATSTTRQPYWLLSSLATMRRHWLVAAVGLTQNSTENGAVPLKSNASVPLT